MTTTRTRNMPQISRRTKLTSCIAAVAAFLVALSAAPAVASWSATAAASSAVTTPTVSIAQSGFDGLSTTFQRNSSDQRGGFTVTNTGAIAGTSSLSVSATGGNAAGIAVRVWPAFSVQECTNNPVPASAAQGTWASFPVPAPTTLEPGTSLTYCVNSTAGDPDSLASASGSQNMTMTATAQLRVSSWLAVAPASATFTTQGFFPLASVPMVGNQNNWFEVRSVSRPSQCLDVYSSAASAGTAVQLWTCGLQANQRFEIYPLQNGQSGIRPRTSAEISIGQSANTSVLAATGSSSANWRIEQATPTSYQLLNADTKLCLTVVDTTQSALSTCTGDASQQFTLTRDPLTCSAAGANINFLFNSASHTRAYTIQNKVGAGPWTNAYTTPTLTVTSYGLTRSMFLAGDATLDIRVVDPQGNVLYSGMTAVTTGTSIACGAGFA
ncbi:RICIN domain-containing protein [Lysinibacter cavernae]|uniref:Ricin B lectin domain-containing protein n=1 Tax=Lysinibacter cavernae TaxID=1640652 RepID=A0A7X5QZY3_9MICO|nr:RICIN domain-containing protein [Lysinibacter cavernae]NIH52977.1 hypothetical protein [Lysinibacter cavernae]